MRPKKRTRTLTREEQQVAGGVAVNVSAALLNENAKKMSLRLFFVILRSFAAESGGAH